MIFADAAASVATALKSTAQGIVVLLCLTRFLIALPAMPVMMKKAAIPIRQPMTGASMQGVSVMTDLL